MSNKCEKKECNNDRSCFHYCSKHHQEICMKGIVPPADLPAAMQARIKALEEVARVAGFIELNRHNYLFNNKDRTAVYYAVYYMDLLKEKLDALKGE